MIRGRHTVDLKLGVLLHDGVFVLLALKLQSFALLLQLQKLKQGVSP